MDNSRWSGWSIPNKQYRSASRVRQERAKALEIALQKLSQLAPDLYQGKPGIDLTPEELQHVLTETVKTLNANASRQAFNFLVSGLDRGNKTGLWDLQVPAPIQVVRHERTQITQDQFVALPQIRRLQEHMTSNLGRSDQKYADDQGLQDLTTIRAGELLLCAILRGQLCTAAYIVALARALADTTPALRITKTHAWIDLSVGRRRGVHKLFRWHPDHASELLLLRWYSNAYTLPSLSQNNPAGSVHAWIVCYLRASGFKITHDLPPTVKKLADQAAILPRLELPGYLAAEASGRSLATHLPAHVWYRVHSGNRCASPEQEAEVPLTSEALLDPREVSTTALDVELRDQAKALRTIVSMMHQQRGHKRVSRTHIAQEIKEWLNDYRPGLSVVTQLLCLWAITLLTKGTRYKKQIAVSSARSYVSQAKLLVHIVGGQNILTMSEEEISRTYRSALESTASSQARQYLAGRLDEFHAFVRTGSELCHLNVHDLRENAGITAAVDANFITETEYQRIHHELRARYPDPVRYQVLLILGYRLGLRRTEAWTLRLHQLQGRDSPELMIISDPLKTLKSENARRRLPIRELMPPPEQKLLEQWWALRRDSLNIKWFEPSDALCFPSDTNAYSPQNEAELFVPLQQIMRQVTGDNDVRFHHLRHSMANTTLVRLQSHNYPELRTHLSGLMDCSWWGNGQQVVGRDHLYQLALLMGHQSPDESISSYCHVTDLIGHALRDRHESTLPFETLATISSKTVSSLRRAHSRSRNASAVKTTLTGQRKRLAHMFQDPIQPQNPKPVTTPLRFTTQAASKNPTTPSVDVLHNALDSVAKQEPLDRIAARLRLCPNQLAEWVRRAQRLFPKDAAAKHEDASCLELPSRPFKQADIDDANALVKRLREINDIEKTIELSWALHHVHAHKKPSHSHVWFGGITDTLRFIKALQSAGIKKDRLRLKLRLPSDTPVNTKKLSARWQRALELDQKHISTGAPLKRAPNVEGACYLRIMNERKARGGARGSYGVFYACLMFLIFLDANAAHA